MSARPQLCLGTVQFGMAYGVAGRAGPMSDGEVRTILEAAQSAGIRRLDTAPAYGNIEERLGTLCSGLDFEIISKVPALPQDCDAAEIGRFVNRSLDQSRQRLGAALRGLLFHGPHDLEGPLGRRAWDAAARWCEQHGVTLGTSTYGPAQLDALAAEYDIAMCQLPGNALDQRLGAFQHRFDAIEVTLRSIFLQGLLLMAYDTAALRLPVAAPALAQWHRWCADRETTPLGGAIALAKNLPGVDFCAVGVDSVDHLEQIAAAWDAAAPQTASELAVKNLAVIDPREWSVIK